MGNDSARRTLSKDELEAILESHKDWVNSSGKTGARADLSNCEFPGVDLQNAGLSCAILRGSKLHGAVLKDADLTEAQLADADLSRADLRGTVLHRSCLQNADLTGAKGPQEENLAGANLSGATLPKDFGEFEGLKYLSEISRHASNVFFMLVAACISSWLLIAATRDVELITGTTTTVLPVIQASVSIRNAYVVVPLILLGLYIYMHLYLQDLKEARASLPAIFPDGLSIEKRSYPWLLTNLIRSQSPEQVSRPIPLRMLRFMVSFAFGWLLVPVTILLFWLFYVRAHDDIRTILQIIILAMTTFFAILSWRLIREIPGNQQLGVTGCHSAGHQELWRQGLFLSIGNLHWAIGVLVVLGCSFWSYKALSGQLVLSKLSCHLFKKDISCHLLHADIEGEDVSERLRGWYRLSKSDQEERLPAKGANLEKKNLRRINASGAFLVKAKLGEAELQDAELVEADLRMANLQGAYLNQAALQGAVLIDADLKNVRLHYANLTDAELKGADFKGAWIAGANFRNTKNFDPEKFKDACDNRDTILPDGIQLELVNCPDQETLDDALNAHEKSQQPGSSKGKPANLTRADLVGKDLSNRNLNNIILKRADLKWASLKRTRLQKANLKGVELLGANLELAELQGANLEKAGLVSANLELAKMQGSRLTGAYLQGANLKEAELQGANLEKAGLVRANLELAKMQRSTLTDAYLQTANLKGANLKGANLEGANLEGANLKEAELQGANLEKAGLVSANLELAKMQRSTLTDAYLQTANLKGANLEGANLEGADLSGTNLKGANLEGCKNLTQQQLDGACGDEKTRLPNGLSISSCDKMH